MAETNVNDTATETTIPAAKGPAAVVLTQTPTPAEAAQTSTAVYVTKAEFDSLLKRIEAFNRRNAHQI